MSMTERIRSRPVQPVAQSLYRLSYSAHHWGPPPKKRNVLELTETGLNILLLRSNYRQWHNFYWSTLWKRIPRMETCPQFGSFQLIYDILLSSHSAHSQISGMSALTLLYTAYWIYGCVYIDMTLDKHFYLWNIKLLLQKAHILP